MEKELENMINDTYNTLITQLDRYFRAIIDDKRDIVKALASNVAILQWHILHKEHVDTPINALQDIMNIAIPMLKIQLQYRHEEVSTKAIFVIITSFLQGILVCAISLGKDYIEPSELNKLVQFKNMLNSNAL